MSYYMDVIFEFYLPAGDPPPGFVFATEYFEWGGEMHPQGDPKCRFGEFFTLEITSFSGYGKNFLDGRMPGTDWQCIRVTGEGLGRLQRSLRAAEEVVEDWEDQPKFEWRGKSLPDLIERLLEGQRRWVAVLLHQCDEYEIIVECGPGEVVGLVESYLTGGPRGFIAVGE